MSALREDNNLAPSPYSLYRQNQRVCIHACRLSCYQHGYGYLFGESLLTQKTSAQLQLDIQKHNAQYPTIEIVEFDRSHDRFLCIDETVYHLGASIKDLGKKWFAFNRMEMSTTELLDNI